MPSSRPVAGPHIPVDYVGCLLTTLVASMGRQPRLARVSAGCHCPRATSTGSRQIMWGWMWVVAAPSTPHATPPHCHAPTHPPTTHPPHIHSHPQPALTPAARPTRISAFTPLPVRTGPPVVGTCGTCVETCVAMRLLPLCSACSMVASTAS